MAETGYIDYEGLLDAADPRLNPERWTGPDIHVPATEWLTIRKIDVVLTDAAIYLQCLCDPVPTGYPLATTVQLSFDLQGPLPIDGVQPVTLAADWTYSHTNQVWNAISYTNATDWNRAATSRCTVYLQAA